MESDESIESDESKKISLFRCLCAIDIIYKTHDAEVVT